MAFYTLGITAVFACLMPGSVNGDRVLRAFFPVLFRQYWYVTAYFGMCLFIMPVIGLTLPFFSYGGSSVVTLFTAMGFVSGIKKRTVVRRRPGRPLGSNAVY